MRACSRAPPALHLQPSHLQPSHLQPDSSRIVPVESSMSHLQPDHLAVGPVDDARPRERAALREFLPAITQQTRGEPSLGPGNPRPRTGPHRPRSRPQPRPRPGPARGEQQPRPRHTSPTCRKARPLRRGTGHCWSARRVGERAGQRITAAAAPASATRSVCEDCRALPSGLPAVEPYSSDFARASTGMPGPCVAEMKVFWM